MNTWVKIHQKSITHPFKKWPAFWATKVILICGKLGGWDPRTDVSVVNCPMVIVSQSPLEDPVLAEINGDDPITTEPSVLGAHPPSKSY